MKLSRGEKIFQVFNYAFLVVLCTAFLIPFLAVLGTSFISTEEWARRGSFVLIPQKVDLAAYRILLQRGSVVLNAYRITLFRVVVGTFLNLAFTSTLAYALAKRELPGRTFLTLIVFIPMIFSGGLIPSFVLADTLGLIDTIWAMIIPGLINPWWLLIMRNFFMGIPVELEEAAIMDGATPPLVFWRITLPLSLPSISTIGLFYAVWHWNAWFDAAIYIMDRAKYPVQLVLRAVLYYAAGGGSVEKIIELQELVPPAQTLKSAMIIVSTLPILVVYPFIQRYFVKGALVGAVKG